MGNVWKYLGTFYDVMGAQGILSYHYYWSNAVLEMQYSHYTWNWEIGVYKGTVKDNSIFLFFSFFLSFLLFIPVLFKYTNHKMTKKHIPLLSHMLSSASPPHTCISYMLIISNTLTLGKLVKKKYRLWQN